MTGPNNIPAAVPAVEPHVRALLALLRAGVPAQLRVELGRGPRTTDGRPGPLPYAVLYPDAGDVVGDRLAGGRGRIDIHVMVHAVAAGPEQAGWAADQVRAVLLTARPVIPGRRVRRIEQVVGSAPLLRDDDITPPLYVQPAQYRITSDPR